MAADRRGPADADHGCGDEGSGGHPEETLGGALQDLLLQRHAGVVLLQGCAPPGPQGTQSKGVQCRHSYSAKQRCVRMLMCIEAVLFETEPKTLWEACIL